MKHSSLLKLLVTLGTAFMLCQSGVEPNNRDYRYEPIFMTRSELERSVRYAGEARPIRETGKIYLYGDTILINEPGRGIHLIDNRNPQSPRAINYIIAPGCIDMAVKDGIIYMDNAVDLVAFDLSSGEVTARIRDYFPEQIYAPDYSVSLYRYDRQEGYILVRWEKTL